MSGDIIVTLKDNVQIVKLNRPKKKNAFTMNMYKDMASILKNAAEDDDIVVTVLTGEGEFYSSGTDLNRNMGEQSDDPIRDAKLTLKEFVDSFINYPKILVAILNGPAIGIAATTLALCDIVYASEKAFIQTPFTKLGLSPEGCSSYTFPKLFGINKAREMLMLGHKMSSLEMMRFGFISEVYKSDEMLNEIWNKIYGMTSLPRESLLHTKSMLRNFDKDSLILANVKECDELESRWKSEEFATAVLNFISRNSKL